MRTPAPPRVSGFPDLSGAPAGAGAVGCVRLALCVPLPGFDDLPSPHPPANLHAYGEHHHEQPAPGSLRPLEQRLRVSHAERFLGHRSEPFFSPDHVQVPASSAHLGAMPRLPAGSAICSDRTTTTSRTSTSTSWATRLPPWPSARPRAPPFGGKTRPPPGRRPAVMLTLTLPPGVHTDSPLHRPSSVGRAVCPRRCSRAVNDGRHAPARRQSPSYAPQGGIRGRRAGLGPPTHFRPFADNPAAHLPLWGRRTPSTPTVSTNHGDAHALEAARMLWAPPSLMRGVGRRGLTRLEWTLGVSPPDTSQPTQDVEMQSQLRSVSLTVTHRNAATGHMIRQLHRAQPKCSARAPTERCAQVASWPRGGLRASQRLWS